MPAQITWLCGSRGYHRLTVGNSLTAVKIHGPVLGGGDRLNTPTERPTGLAVSTIYANLPDDPCAMIGIGHDISFTDGIQVYSDSFTGCVNDPHVVGRAEIKMQCFWQVEAREAVVANVRYAD